MNIRAFVAWLGVWPILALSELPRETAHSAGLHWCIHGSLVEIWGTGIQGVYSNLASLAIQLIFFYPYVPPVCISQLTKTPGPKGAIITFKPKQLSKCIHPKGYCGLCSKSKAPSPAVLLMALTSTMAPWVSANMGLLGPVLHIIVWVRFFSSPVRQTRDLLITLHLYYI